MDIKLLNRTIDRPINKLQTYESNKGLFAVLFAEIVNYNRSKVKGVTELEEKYPATLIS